MATKYKRPGHEDEKFDWEVRGRSVKSTRQRLVFINLALCAACLGLFLLHFMGKNATERWLSMRNGTGVIVEKIEEVNDLGEVTYFLAVRVTVPVANEKDASFLVGNEDEIANKASEVVLGDKISTDPQSFTMVEEGDSVSVDYQIDMQRKRILIRKMYLME